MFRARDWTSKTLPPLKNPLLRKEREEKERQRQASLRKVRSVVDTGVPPTYVMRRKQRAKERRQQGTRFVVGLTKQRLNDIEKQNQLLLSRMVKIATDEPHYKKHPVPRQRESTYQVNRRQSLRRINRGNVKLLERLVEQQVQPGEFSVERMKQDERRRRKLLRHMCAYPYRDPAAPGTAAGPSRSASAYSLQPASGAAPALRVPRARSRPRSRARGARPPPSRRPRARSAAPGHAASTPALLRSPRGESKRKGGKTVKGKGGKTVKGKGGKKSAAAAAAAVAKAPRTALDDLLSQLGGDWAAFRLAQGQALPPRPLEDECVLLDEVRDDLDGGGAPLRVRVTYVPAAAAKPATDNGGEEGEEAAGGGQSSSGWSLEVAVTPADASTTTTTTVTPASVTLDGYHLECSLQAFPALLLGEYAADLAAAVAACLTVPEGGGPTSADLSAVSSLGLQLQIRERLSTVASGKTTHLRPRTASSRPGSRLASPAAAGGSRQRRG